MPKRAATTAADFAATEREGVRILADGTVELASVNLLSNPALLDVDADGNPVGWGTLVGPPEVAGFNVYDGRARQNRYPLTVETYYQSTAPRYGTPYPQNALKKDTQTPAAPTVAAEDNSALGFASDDGFFGFALAWVSASEAGDHYTAPSDRETIELDEGDRVDLSDLPTLVEAPVGATALAILSTNPQTLQSIALTATLYVREVIPLKDLSSAGAYTLSGPATGDAAPADETGVGGFEDYGALEWRIRPSLYSLLAGSYPVTWRFSTASGVSAAQSSVTVEVPEDMQGRIEVRPRLKPNRATAWQPVWRNGGVYRTTPEQEPNFRKFVPILTTPSVDTTIPTVDESAIDPPPAPTLAVSTEAPPDLSGNHKIRVTLDYGGNVESAPSPPTSVTLTSTETYSVEMPSEAGGYTTVLYDPVDRHSDLTGIAHNQIQYSAPAGTVQDYRITNGLPQVVVNGGSSYVLSAHIKAEDISAASMYEVIFRDAAGEAITSADPLVELTAGDHAWARYQKAYAAPSGAVFMEVFGHKVGEGTITLAPPQIEEGAVATDFDPGLPASGYVIAVFETTSSAQVRFGPRPAGFQAGGAVITPDEDYTYTITYASSADAPTELDPASDWTYFSDIEDVTFEDYVAVRVEIEEAP